MNVRKSKRNNTEQSEGKFILKVVKFVCLVVLLLHFMFFESMYHRQSNKLSCLILHFIPFNTKVSSLSVWCCYCYNSCFFKYVS